jgi:hypothetical protein
MSLSPQKTTRRIKMMTKNQDDDLVQCEPLTADRMMKTQCEVDVKWIAGGSTVLPHFLNEEKIAETMRKNAILVPFKKTIESKNGQSITIQCSTGAYYAVGVDLCHFWMVMLGQSSSCMDGMMLEDVSYKGDKDLGGAFQRYSVKLNVDGIDIMVAFHNTTNKVQVQGQQDGVKKFAEMLPIRYIERNSHEKALKIAEINDLVKLSKRTRGKTTSLKDM